jgi:hypothetical protein
MQPGIAGGLGRAVGRGSFRPRPGPISLIQRRSERLARVGLATRISGISWHQLRGGLGFTGR